MARATHTIERRVKTRTITEAAKESVIILELDKNEAEAIQWYLTRAAAHLNGSLSAWRSSAINFHEGSLHAAGVRVFDALGPAISDARLGKVSK